MPCFSSISVNGVERTAIRWPISCQRFPVAKQKKRRKRGRRKKSVDRKKRRKKKPMAYTSKNCRHFFTKDYRRFFNTTSIQTRLQQPILVNVYDRYIHTRDREREIVPAKGTRNYAAVRSLWKKLDPIQRGGTIPRKEKWIDTHTGNPVGRR